MAITNAALALSMSDLIAHWQDVQDEFQAWINGTVGGGPNSNGKYPLTDYLNVVRLTTCPAQLVSDSSAIPGAAASATAAAASATAAATSATTATTQASSASASATTASTQASAASSSASAAASSAATAVAQASAASASATAAAASAVLAATFNPALYAVLAGPNAFTGNVAGAIAQSFTNSSVNAAAFTTLRHANDAGRLFQFGYTSSAVSAALFTGGPATEHGFFYTSGAMPISIGTANIERMRISGAGDITLTGSALTLNNASPQITINETDGNNGAYLGFQNAGALRGYVFSAHAASAGIAGTADGDMGIIAANGGLFFSGNGGTTAHLKLSSAGIVTTPNASASEVGYKGTPQNVQGGSYTLVLADNGKDIVYNGAGGHTFTIPARASVAYPNGAVFTITNFGSASLSIATTTNITYLDGSSLGTTGTRTLAKGATARVKIMSSTENIISGGASLT